MSTAGRLLGAVLTAAVLMTPGLASAQASASSAAAPAASYGSYLSAPAQDNRMLRGGLDADEIIGSEVVAADGSRVGAVTDLLVGPDGGISHAAVDAGQALGMGSRHVAVELAKLQPTDKGSSTLRLEADGRELAGMAAYHQVGDRWERLP